MEFTWLQEHALVIAFYIIVGLLIYFNRKKFEFQGIVALFKTTFGIKAMKSFATPLSSKKNVFGKRLFSFSLVIMIVFIVLALVSGLFNVSFLNEYVVFLIIRIILMLSFLGLCVAIVYFRQIKPAGTLGIYVGFLGMIFMLGLIGVGLWQLFFDPSAPPMFAPVLPGISIPGSPFKLPLFEGLIALLVVVVIHEFSHGVVSKSYKVPIKSSGFVMFGPIPGAFVEPDEQKLKKASVKAQLSVYGAGPFSNMLLAGFVFIILALLSILSVSLYTTSGVVVEDILIDQEHNNFFVKGDIIIGAYNESINQRSDLIRVINQFSPGDSVNFTTNNGVRNIVLSSSPDNESAPYIGILLDNHVVGTKSVSQNKVFTSVYFWLVGNPYSFDLNKSMGLIFLIFVLSFGIGIVNLLPVGPLDGGRMFYLVLRRKYNEKKSLRILSWLSKILLLLIIILVFIPIIRALI